MLLDGASRSGEGVLLSYIAQQSRVTLHDVGTGPVHRKSPRTGH